jgi:chitinase
MKKYLKIIILGLFVLGILAFIFFRHYSPNASVGFATLSWNKNTDASITGYKIYYGTKPRSNDCPSGGYDNNIDVKNKTKYSFNDLQPGKTYYFSVTSYNGSGKESCFSPEMKKKISRLNWIGKIF